MVYELNTQWLLYDGQCGSYCFFLTQVCVSKPRRKKGLLKKEKRWVGGVEMFSQGALKASKVCEREGWLLSVTF